MADEEIQVNETPETNYIEVINNLRNNTVSKAEYEKALKDNKMLAEALATTPAQAAAEEVVTLPTDEEVQGLRDKLFNTKHMTNLEYIRTSLELRDALLARGERDPFLPNNNGYVDNDVDNAKVEAMAKGLQQMVDYCGNDAKLFNSELQRCCR